MELTINFSIRQEPKLFRNIYKVDWQKLQTKITQEINNLPLNNLNSTQDIDIAVKSLTETVNKVFNEECPLR